MTGNFTFVSNPARDTSMNAFEYSLAHLSAADIAPAKEKKVMSGKQIAFNLFRYGMMALFIGIFIYCVYLVAAESASYARTGTMYSDLANQYASDDFVVQSQSEIPALTVGAVPTALPDYESRLAGITPETSQTATSGALARAKIERLKEMNAEAVGWINIPGTDIDYPVMQTQDNEYYLTHDFNHEKSFAGCLFFESRISDTVSENMNTVVYGHNMEGGMMFNKLTNYLDEDFFYENRYIYLDTNEGICVYEIFSVFKAHMSDNYYYVFFDSQRDFVDFCYEMKYKSVFPVDEIEFEEGDQIITLSTCTNENQQERYAVQGKLIRIER